MTLTVSEIQVISDGDSDSDGDLWFTVLTCPRRVLEDFYLIGNYTHQQQWSEGRHALNRELTSAPPSVPDRLRLLVVGIDDDSDITSDPFADYFDDNFSCDRAGGVIEPNKNSKGEWNAVIMDLDLSKCPGAKGGEPFVRRSQPLRNGSTLMFEVRGHITVTRE